MPLNSRRDPDRLGLKELVAMGVGGMVGGGIFSVLGLAVGMAGHAAPVAFALGGAIALLTGLSYARLGVAFRSSGGSFTYMEHAFRHPNMAAIGGWLLLAGYVGTLALYAYTFGVYGSAMLGESNPHALIGKLLGSLVLLVFLAVNLYGVKASGRSEDVIVLIKVLLLSLFAISGFFFVRADHLLPLFDRGSSGLLVGAALIFVAYEGFELIPNAVNDMQDVEHHLPRAILISIAITTVIYILVSLVAVGNLSAANIAKYQEYALAVAARPFLGQAGFLLVGLGAILSTASAINATLFGTARLGMGMAKERAIPCVFALRERTADIPWVSLCAITSLALLLLGFGNLTLIASFASASFLLIFALINISAWRLRAAFGGHWGLPLLGAALCVSAWVVLLVHLWLRQREVVVWIAIAWLGIAVAELLFSARRRVPGRSSRYG